MVNVYTSLGIYSVARIQNLLHRFIMLKYMAILVDPTGTTINQILDLVSLKPKHHTFNIPVFRPRVHWIDSNWLNAIQKVKAFSEQICPEFLRDDSSN